MNAMVTLPWVDLNISPVERMPQVGADFYTWLMFAYLI